MECGSFSWHNQRYAKYDSKSPNGIRVLETEIIEGLTNCKPIARGMTRFSIRMPFNMLSSTSERRSEQKLITGSNPACSLEFSTVICCVKTRVTAKIPIELHNVTFGQLHEILHV